MKKRKKKVVLKKEIFIILIAFLALFLFWAAASLNRTDKIYEQDPDAFQEHESVQDEKDKAVNSVEDTEAEIQETEDEIYGYAIDEISSPEELIAYLNEFSMEPIAEWKSKGLDEFIQDKSGSAVDFAVFSAYALQKNNYQSVIIRYNFIEKKDRSTGSGVVVVFRDTDNPKFLSFCDGEIKAAHHGWSFEDMFIKEEENNNIEIYEFADFNPYSLDLNTDSWIKREK